MLAHINGEHQRAAISSEIACPSLRPPAPNAEPRRCTSFSTPMRNVTPHPLPRSHRRADPVEPPRQDGRFERDADMRLRRLRSVSWFLDRSIPIGRWRIGVDPLIGIIPGAGDWIGALLSLYVFYEGARLGMSAPVLTRMAGNILIETIVGAVPVLGDMFDFVWQANTRNVALIERHYRPGNRARSLEQIGWFVVAFAALVLTITAGLIYVLFKGVGALFN